MLQVHDESALIETWTDELGEGSEGSGGEEMKNAAHLKVELRDRYEDRAFLVRDEIKAGRKELGSSN